MASKEELKTIVRMANNPDATPEARAAASARLKEVKVQFNRSQESRSRESR